MPVVARAVDRPPGTEIAFRAQFTTAQYRRGESRIVNRGIPSDAIHGFRGAVNFSQAAERTTDGVRFRSRTRRWCWAAPTQTRARSRPRDARTSARKRRRCTPRCPRRRSPPVSRPARSPRHRGVRPLAGPRPRASLLEARLARAPPLAMTPRAPPRSTRRARRHRRRAGARGPARSARLPRRAHPRGGYPRGGSRRPAHRPRVRHRLPFQRSTRSVVNVVDLTVLSGQG